MAYNPPNYNQNNYGYANAPPGNYNNNMYQNQNNNFGPPPPAMNYNPPPMNYGPPPQQMMSKFIFNWLRINYVS